MNAKIKNYNTKYFNEPPNRSNILIKELFEELINAPGRLLNVPNLRTTNSELFEIVLLLTLYARRKCLSKLLARITN